MPQTRPTVIGEVVGQALPAAAPPFPRSRFPLPREQSTLYRAPLRTVAPGAAGQGSEGLLPPRLAADRRLRAEPREDPRSRSGAGRPSREGAVTRRPPPPS